jgi:hypothetical protein
MRARQRPQGPSSREAAPGRTVDDDVKPGLKDRVFRREAARMAAGRRSGVARSQTASPSGCAVRLIHRSLERSVVQLDEPVLAPARR